MPVPGDGAKTEEMCRHFKKPHFLRLLPPPPNIWAVRYTPLFFASKASINAWIVKVQKWRSADPFDKLGCPAELKSRQTFVYHFFMNKRNKPQYKTSICQIWEI